MNQNITKKPSNFYSKLVSFFLLLTVIAILIIVHFALAKVNIKLYSNLEEKEASVLITMKPEDDLEIASDEILGKIITNELELTASVDSNEELTNSDRAGGYVTIYNNYSKNQPLIKTTRLLTPDDKLFRITEGVTIPAGGQVEVWAEADEDGEGFVTEATTFIIPGLWEGLQKLIYAKSLDGMKLQSVPGFKVSEENIAAAHQKIEQDAISQSLTKINDLVGEKLTIDASRLKLDFETLESSEVGSTSKEATVKEKVTVNGLVFDEEDLLKAARDKFSKELDSQQTIVNFEENNFSYNILEINLDKNEAIIEVVTTVTVSSGENTWDIDKDQLVGLDENSLREYLEQFNPEKIEIKFFPFWVKTVPKLKDHIIIE